ncbi:MAG: D-alanine--D-alanine ligase [Actinobacteria bacterium]|nr:D-alanine--D-alanine ligase [Actinomycetota bacterium]MBU1492647.1 D-alanine--D-alanine ligase [Actinomycetota bacterium]
MCERAGRAQTGNLPRMAKVVVFFGGRSEEHEVSCVSAVAVVEALTEKGHEVLAVGIRRDGSWRLADPVERPLVAEGREAFLEMPSGVLRAGADRHRFDVAFPVLHGPYGEDGTVQGMFEMAGVPYVGSGVVGSAVAMDKDIAKRLFRDAGLAISPFVTIRAGGFSDDPAGITAKVRAELGYPVFVKPAELGSSVGISRADDDGSFKDGVLEALRHGDKVLVEQEVRGREIEVAVLEGPRSSLPGEIVVAGWYTYDAKYQDDATTLLVPAPLSEPATAAVRELAGRAFTALECRGLARVDFFYEEDGRGFVINEINTMPGFTPKSMFPMMWAATGMPYSDLCDELVSLALEA